MYVHIRSERNLWTVGHYTPEGMFIPTSDHDTNEEAEKLDQLHRKLEESIHEIGSLFA